MTHEQPMPEKLGDFIEDVVTAVGADRTRQLTEKIEQLNARLQAAQANPGHRGTILELRYAANDLRMTCGTYVGYVALNVGRAAERLGTRLLLGTRVAHAEWARVYAQLDELRGSVRLKG
jgi:hypothetical protein